MSLITPSTHCRYSTMHLKSSQRFNISSFKGTGKRLCKSMIYGAFSFLYARLDLSLLHSVYAFLGLTVKPKVKP